MKKKEILKKSIPWMIIFAVLFMAYKFVAWNYWMVERSIKLAKGIFDAPPAVNLSLVMENKTVFRQGFSFNPNGNFYVINRFDITPYITDTFKLNFFVNRQKIEPSGVYRFKTYNIIPVKKYYFIFTTPDCHIEDFVELRKILPGIIRTITHGDVGNGKDLDSNKIQI